MMKEEILNWLGTLPYGNYLQNQYVFAFLILVSFIILAEIILFVFGFYLNRVAKKTATLFDDLIFEKTRKPLSLLAFFFGLRLSLLHLDVHNYVMQAANSALAVIFILILVRVIDVIIETWGQSFAKKTRTSVDEVLLPLFHKIVKVIFSIVAIMWVLDIWQIDITPYLAGVGISGLVLGFALQDSLKNIFGGVSLIIDKNFNIGDAVRLESGEMGVIKEIGLRSTKMLTYDNELIFVPNGQLANMKISNYMRPNHRVRKIVEFGVAYGSNVEKVKKVVLEALQKIDKIYSDPYMDVIFVEMGDFALKFKARFWVDWDNAYAKWVEATEVIHATLLKAKIEIPFPTQTLYLKKEK
ncbi:hypothetical protein COV20_04515 [Candidatus Woesearchaeota archaeon CG10_big_fil_rev_8_21_14_0_10_45_16]|nr:MAG: hypothetical protein COV20_04515 [Candidatus Woesearchaeota archaeon CG10_big_fil_rev_8_21_14_0_10_45_16]